MLYGKITNMELESSETFQHQALEIREPGEDFDPSVEPQNGEEYLMHMMYERKRCPAVVSKKPKSLQDMVPPTVTPGPSNSNTEELMLSADFVSDRDLLPTIEWKELQYIDFLRTRSKILIMRQYLASQNYDNAREPPLITDEEAWLKFCREYEPKLSVILRLNQRTLEQLLEMLCEWLKGENMDQVIVSSSSAATNGVLDLASSDQWLGSWLYGVLACLHLPLEPGVHGTLRVIARTCIQLRSRLMSQEFQKAVPYNLFIYLIAKVFDQLDLMEFV